MCGAVGFSDKKNHRPISCIIEVLTQTIKDEMTVMHNGKRYLYGTNRYVTDTGQAL